MAEIRKLIRFDILEARIITETAKRYGTTYNGAIALIIRNWREITSGKIQAKESKNE